MFDIKQFDVVQLKTTKRVTFLVSPDGNTVSPHGFWSVVGIIDKTDLLVCKDGATCRIPIEDVTKVAEFDEKKFMEIKNGKESKKHQE